MLPDVVIASGSTKVISVFACKIILAEAAAESILVGSNVVVAPTSLANKLLTPSSYAAPPD